MTNAIRNGCALLVLCLAGCGGGGNDSAAPPASALHLESAAAVTQSIGPAGGTLATTAADGTRYTLTVPARALRSATAITLSPIAAIADLPSGVSLAGGAHLTPEGLRFDLPLTLSIALTAAPASPPVPFTYDGELQQRHLYPANISGKTIEFEIVHFSGYAALVGALDGALGYFPPPSARGDQGLQELVEAGILGLDAPAARDTAMRNALQGWLDEFIKPEVAALGALSSYELDAFMTGRVAGSPTS